MTPCAECAKFIAKDRRCKVFTSIAYFWKRYGYCPGFTRDPNWESDVWAATMAYAQRKRESDMLKAALNKVKINPPGPHIIRSKRKLLQFYSFVLEYGMENPNKAVVIVRSPSTPTQYFIGEELESALLAAQTYLAQKRWLEKDDANTPDVGTRPKGKE